MQVNRVYTVIMSYEPLVSVVMPAYNAAAFVRVAIASALAQTYSNLEVLVVDDGSTDETPQIVAEMAQEDARVRLLRQPNGGVAAARNLAIAHARGEFIAPLDADDAWMPAKIMRQVAAMREGGPKVGLVYTWWLGTDKDGEFVDAGAQWDVEGRVLSALLYCNFIGNASVPLFRREALDRVGDYNAQLRVQNAQGCEDWDITLRVAEHYEVRCVPAYLSCYRDVSGSMAKNCESMAKSHELITRAMHSRHPDIPAEVLLWSRSLFLIWLTGLSYHGGRYRDSLRWGLLLLRTDPAAASSLWVLQTLSLSALWTLVSPLTACVWSDREGFTFWKRGWRTRMKRVRRSRDRKDLALQATHLVIGASSMAMPDAIHAPAPIGKPHIWPSSLWRQYDRVCLRRWESLVKLSARHA